MPIIDNSIAEPCPYYSSQECSNALPRVSVYTEAMLNLFAHAMVVTMQISSAGQSYNASTEAELTAQKMSNETNKVLVDVQNQVNSDNNPDHKGSLPDDVVDYINAHEIAISGVNEDANGNFEPIATTSPTPSGQVANSFTEGQLQAIKGEFDIEATSYSSSNSSYQMMLQMLLQVLTQSVTAISQVSAKQNQVMSQIINNMK
ncbi:hypothetical protein HZV92_001837 [Salmonella enterica]|nr:hypothetical protein [Salmonella enterica]EFQ6618176.1 hypothetical protein [Salmonella enterica]